ncbi:hypothetical protein P8452_12935 [Trifolium repens]|nr:hypothetical protein P8452_12926 [Trifolium repens]WJX23746.1 hypothetical protein P8452_12935 [Trifolium repens]
MATQINLLFFIIAIICLASVTFAEVDLDAEDCFAANYCPNQSFHCSEVCKGNGFRLGGSCYVGMAKCCCHGNKSFIV